MTDHQERLAACEGKYAFPDYARAEEVVQRMRRRRKKKPRISVYRCHYCHFWHVGSIKRIFKDEMDEQGGVEDERTVI